MGIEVNKKSIAHHQSYPLKRHVLEPSTVFSVKVFEILEFKSKFENTV